MAAINAMDLELKRVSNFLRIFSAQKPTHCKMRLSLAEKYSIPMKCLIHMKIDSSNCYAGIHGYASEQNRNDQKDEDARNSSRNAENIQEEVRYHRQRSIESHSRNEVSHFNAVRPIYFNEIELIG